MKGETKHITANAEIARQSISVKTETNCLHLNTNAEAIQRMKIVRSERHGTLYIMLFARVESLKRNPVNYAEAQKIYKGITMITTNLYK
jgi:hypothetical protein